MNLREWRKSKELSQEGLGRKLGLGDQWKTYQSYESGRTDPPQSIKDKLKQLGYAGAWKAVSAAEAPSITRDEFIELRGALKSFVEYWQAGEEKVLQRLEAMDQRLQRLEKKAGLSEKSS